MGGSASCDLVGLVDLERYPIDAQATDAFDDLCRRCRADLDRDGVAILPGFTTPDALAQLVTEAAGQAPLGHPSDVVGSPYLEPVDHTAWPDGHPRRSQGHTRLTAVAYDLFDAESVLRRLYESDTLLAFLTAALGFTVHRYDDALGGLNLAAMYDGDELMWHFDQTDFVVSLAVQSSDEGGEFECVHAIRSATDERYDDVAALLAGDHSRVQVLPMQPGTLLLFEGRRSIHRVAPIVGSVPRYVGLLGYDRTPGTCSSESLRRTRYGRIA